MIASLRVACFLFSVAGVSSILGQGVNMHIYTLSPQAAKTLRLKQSSGGTLEIPKNTLIRKLTLLDQEIPKNAGPRQASNYLQAKGISCCGPLTHAYGDLYWCCDMTTMIEIVSGSSSGKKAFEDLVRTASMSAHAGASATRTTTTTKTVHP
jgi:hypothetical protein